MSRTIRISGVVCALACPLALAAQTAPSAGGGVPGKAAIQRYCLGCHNTQSKAANLALDTVVNAPAGQHPAEWEKVVKRLRGRSMPPAGLPRPDEQTYQTLQAGLEKTLDAQALASPNPGRTDTFRRLNRTEYRNAIRDLLALDVDVSSLLPADDASHGFDNVTVGTLSPTLLERYLGAARRISRLAIGIAPKAPGGDTVTLVPDLTQEDHFEDLPLGTRGGAVVQHTFPVDAEYEIQLRLQRDRNEHVEGLTAKHQVELMLDGERVALFTVEPPPPGKDHSQSDQHLQARLAIKAGPHTVSVAFPKQTSALQETERQPYQAFFNMDRHPRPQPALYQVSINGPYEAKGAGKTPSRERLFVCRPSSVAQEEACAARILSTFARRAYRRPVTDTDVAVPMKFFRQARPEGDFDNAIEMAVRAVLVSPEFIFRVERDPEGIAAGTAYRVSNLELASRLSFFLWSSIPDDELLDAAVRGDLAKPEVLERQARRMLADPRSRQLASNFAGQWLYLRNLNSILPDMRLFAGFDDNLRQSFRRETELFFESIMAEDRSVLDLLRANYTFLNERLAKHYRIPYVYGSHFRRVELTPESQRGGLLRHGSILTVTSYATRTSPVLRGKWILENILGVPPPPPPPAVPALGEKASTGKPLTMRDRLAEHRKNPACFGCHQLMDPVGFAMENYDAVGRWRATEDAVRIDASGGLPDGSKFVGVGGLQQALLARPEMFSSALAEKLITYALGRGVETYDAPAIRQVLRQSAAEDYRFSSFILGVVRSAPFQMRRSL